MKEVKQEQKRKLNQNYDSSSSSSSDDRRKKKKKKDKKSKKDRSEKKKHKKRRRNSSDVSGVEVPVTKVKEEAEWVELTKELRDEEAQKAREEEAQFIGPQIPESLLAKARADTSTSYYDLDPR